MPATVQSEYSQRSLLTGVLCYVIWGFFPLYFHLLAPAGAMEVIVHRAVWGMLFCLVGLAALRQLSQLRAALRSGAVVWRLAVAGCLIVVNWTVYVYAVQSGHTVDAALGYFINPLVTVALGLIVLRERINRLQTLAVCLGAVAVLVLVIGLGRLPWISLVLAVSFGTYSLSKKDVAHRVSPLAGMAIETGAVVPALVAYYVWLLAHHDTSFNQLAEAGRSDDIWWHALLLVGAGFLTMVPLLLFASAAKGLPLGTIGMLQFITPVLQLLIGILVFHEPMEAARWIGTAIVWLALTILTIDTVRTSRALKRLRDGG